MHLGTARTTAALLGSLVLAACGGGDDGADTDATTGASDDAGADEGTDASAGSGDEATDDGDAAASASATATEPPAPEDGWNGTHDELEPIGPGQGLLEVGGESIELEVTCATPGPLEDHELFLFSFDAVGEGVDSDGREVSVDVSRKLKTEPESFYDYDGYATGSIQITVATGDDSSPFRNAIVSSPADDDSAGDLLPLLRVDEDGTFTAIEEVPVLGPSEGALFGATELVGTCQDAWPDDASEDAPIL